jgi:hypothetical protein
MLAVSEDPTEWNKLIFLAANGYITGKVTRDVFILTGTDGVEFTVKRIKKD